MVRWSAGVLAPFIDTGGSSDWDQRTDGTLTSAYRLLEVPGLIEQRMAQVGYRNQSIFWFVLNILAAPAASIALSLAVAVAWSCRAPLRLVAGLQRALQLLMPWAFLEAYAVALLILVPEMQFVAHWIFNADGTCPLPVDEGLSCLEIRGEFTPGTWVMVGLMVTYFATAQLAVYGLRPRRKPAAACAPAAEPDPTGG